MVEHTSLVVFRLEGQRYAVPLGAVERIVGAVEVTALPGAPGLVLGVIDVGGSVVPVLDLRRRLFLPPRLIGPADQMMIARTSDRVVALVIDEVHGVIEHEPSAVVASSHVAHGLDALPGVVRLEDGLVFIHDLDRFLSTDEARVLETAMSQGLSC